MLPSGSVSVLCDPTKYRVKILQTFVKTLQFLLLKQFLTFVKVVSRKVFNNSANAEALLVIIFVLNVKQYCIALTPNKDCSLFTRVIIAVTITYIAYCVRLLQFVVKVCCHYL